MLASMKVWAPSPVSPASPSSPATLATCRQVCGDACSSQNVSCVINKFIQGSLLAIDLILNTPGQYHTIETDRSTGACFQCLFFQLKWSAFFPSIKLARSSELWSTSTACLMYFLCWSSRERSTAIRANPFRGSTLFKMSFKIWVIREWTTIAALVPTAWTRFILRNTHSAQECCFSICRWRDIDHWWSIENTSHCIRRQPPVPA